LTVRPAKLTVTALDQVRALGQPNPPFSVAYSGLVNGDTPSKVFSSGPSCTSPATPASPIGAYPITCTATLRPPPHYQARFVAGTLRVGKARLLLPLVVRPSG